MLNLTSRMPAKEQAGRAGSPPAGKRLDQMTDVEAAFERILDWGMEEVRRRLGDRSLRVQGASDIAISVACDLFEAAREIEFRGGAQLRALVRNAVRWKVRDKLRHYRAQRRDIERELVDCTARDAPADPALEPDERAMLAEREAELVARMRVLSDRERRLLELRSTGLSHRKISAALGISEQNARRILCDVCKKILDRGR